MSKIFKYASIFAIVYGIGKAGRAIGRLEGYIEGTVDALVESGAKNYEKEVCGIKIKLTKA